MTQPTPERLEAGRKAMTKLSKLTEAALGCYPVRLSRTKLLEHIKAAHQSSGRKVTISKRGPRLHVVKIEARNAKTVTITGRSFLTIALADPPIKLRLDAHANLIEAGKARHAGAFSRG